MIGCFSAVACLASTMAPAVAGDFAVPLAAHGPAADDEWQYGFEMYGWVAGIKGTTITGSKIDIDFDEILDDFNMAAMMAFSARKGRWAFGSDLIYLDIGTDVYSMRRGPVRTSVDLKSWIATPMASYTAVEGDWGRLDVLAGARYLYLKAELGVTEVLPLTTPSVYTTDSASSWAAIVGIKGMCNEVGEELLVSEDLLERLDPLPADLRIESIGSVELRGREQAVRIFSVHRQSPQSPVSIP